MSSIANTSKLLTDFEQQGFLNALPLLDAAALSYVRDLSVAQDNLADINAAKALWRVDPRILEMARCAPILAMLDQLFKGDGYFLWGAQLIDREPGQTHEWHCDAETASDGFVSLWIAVNGIVRESSLRVISGSHRMENPLQAQFAWKDPARSDPTGSALAERVRDTLGDGEVEITGCRPGEGIFFDGRLWHATFNPAGMRRRSLLLQYGRHGVPVRQCRDRTQYPFEYEQVHIPSVVSLRGHPDPMTNTTWMVDANGGLGLPVARTHAAPPLVAVHEQGWSQHPYFETATPVMEHLRCHASVLRGGVIPHLPHEHDDEELLIVLAGSAGIVTRAGDAGQWQVEAAEVGDVFYYPSGYSHTIMNHSLGPAAEPLAYVMFRWKARASRVAAVAPFRIPSSVVRGDKRLIMNQPSSRLGKLHVHTTELKPGQKFPRHIDRYDSTFVVLWGELTVIDQTLGPGGVFLTRAGELHDTANTGAEPCKYLVFEFHHESSVFQPVP